MRIAAFSTRGLPGVVGGEVELPVGLVAVVAGDGRARRALARALTGADPGSGEVSVLPRVPDPTLARLPDGLAHRLRTGRGLGEADPVVEAGARALAWFGGLDRVEAARSRLARLRGAGQAREGPSAEAVLARIRELEGAPEELAALEADLRVLRGDDVEVAGDLEQATMEWLRERQDAETQLQAYRDRARELRARLGGLGADDEGATCPTCGRPLGDHREAVHRSLSDEWESVVQDGSWWRRRREQLELKPDALQDLERRALRVRAATEALAERVELARARVRELDDLRARLTALAPEDQDEGPHVPRLVWEVADTTLARAAGELRERARDRILDRTTGYLVRITAGRVLGLSWVRPGTLAMETVDGTLHPAGDEDAAAALVAARIAALELVWEEAGVERPALLLAEGLDRLDDAARIRAVDLLGECVRRGFNQVVVVTRGEIVDLFPEGFDAVVELRGDGLGASRTPGGVGMLRLAADVSRPEPGPRPP